MCDQLLKRPPSDPEGHDTLPGIEKISNLDKPILEKPKVSDKYHKRKIEAQPNPNDWDLEGADGTENIDESDDSTKDKYKKPRRSEVVEESENRRNFDIDSKLEVIGSRVDIEEFDIEPLPEEEFRSECEKMEDEKIHEEKKNKNISLKKNREWDKKDKDIAYEVWCDDEARYRRLYNNEDFIDVHVDKEEELEIEESANQSSFRTQETEKKKIDDENVIKKLLNKEELTPLELAKVNEIIKYKRALEEGKRGKFDKIEYKVESKVTVPKKMKKKKKKRFRNLYEDEDSDEDEMEEDEAEELPLLMSSVHQPEPIFTGLKSYYTREYNSRSGIDTNRQYLGHKRYDKKENHRRLSSEGYSTLKLDSLSGRGNQSSNVYGYSSNIDSGQSFNGQSKVVVNLNVQGQLTSGIDRQFNDRLFDNQHFSEQFISSRHSNRPNQHFSGNQRLVKQNSTKKSFTRNFNNQNYTNRNCTDLLSTNQYNTKKQSGNQHSVNHHSVDYSINQHSTNQHANNQSSTNKHLNNQQDHLEKDMSNIEHRFSNTEQQFSNTARQFSMSNRTADYQTSSSRPFHSTIQQSPHPNRYSSRAKAPKQYASNAHFEEQTTKLNQNFSRSNQHISKTKPKIYQRISRNNQNMYRSNRSSSDPDMIERRNSSESTRGSNEGIQALSKTGRNSQKSVHIASEVVHNSDENICNPNESVRYLKGRSQSLSEHCRDSSERFHNSSERFTSDRTRKSDGLMRIQNEHYCNSNERIRYIDEHHRCSSEHLQDTSEHRSGSDHVHSSSEHLYSAACTDLSEDICGLDENLRKSSDCLHGSKSRHHKSKEHLHKSNEHLHNLYECNENLQKSSEHLQKNLHRSNEHLYKSNEHFDKNLHRLSEHHNSSENSHNDSDNFQNITDNCYNATDLCYDGRYNNSEKIGYQNSIKNSHNPTEKDPRCSISDQDRGDLGHLKSRDPRLNRNYSTVGGR